MITNTVNSHCDISRSLSVDWTEDGRRGGGRTVFRVSWHDCGWRQWDRGGGWTRESRQLMCWTGPQGSPLTSPALGNQSGIDNLPLRVEVTFPSDSSLVDLIRGN